MKGFKKFLKLTICIFLIICIAICSVIIKEGYSMYKDALSEISLTDKIAQIKKDKNYITIDKIPTTFKDAIIAVEDHRFYSHNGFDIIATARSFITNIKDKNLTAGGSTITQQLAKNLYFTQEKKFTRKVAELFVAFDLEKIYEKNDILELYVNVIYYGEGYIGIKEASNGYFDKEPMELTQKEQTILAGLPNAPSAYSLTKNSDLAIKRQNMVIDAMVKYEKLSKEEAQKIRSEQNN